MQDYQRTFVELALSRSALRFGTFKLEIDSSLLKDRRYEQPLRAVGLDPEKLGGASRVDGFREMLQERFNTPVEDFDPFRVVARITSGPYAGAEVTAVQAGDAKQIDDETTIDGPTEFLGLACEAGSFPAAAGAGAVAAGRGPNSEAAPAELPAAQPRLGRSRSPKALLPLPAMPPLCLRSAACPCRLRWSLPRPPTSPPRARPSPAATSAMGAVPAPPAAPPRRPAARTRRREACLPSRPGPCLRSPFLR